VPAQATDWELGAYGELLAAKALRKRGYRVLRQNFKAPHGGEVDIVCRHGEFLVFVEVKTRRTETYGDPAEAVTLSKQRLIERGAMEWLRLLGMPEILFRFDVAEVRVIEGKAEVNIIADAFTLSERYTY
jgi:putative endonuclease